jgi:hypothetical protein
MSPITILIKVTYVNHYTYMHLCHAKIKMPNVSDSVQFDQKNKSSKSFQTYLLLKRKQNKQKSINISILDM